MNILFTCAGRRNYLLNFFKEELKGDGITIAADMQISAPAMAEADKKFIVSEIYSEGYIDVILDICKNENVNALISFNDLELPLLSKRKNEFDKLGVKLLVSDVDVINICFDKIKTVEFAKDIGVLTPKTYTSLTLAKEALITGDLKFPLVVKPRWGSASIGLEFPVNFQELDLSFELLKMRLSRTILAEASKIDLENAILIQEKIQGKEYGVDILNNFKAETIEVYVKEKLSMRAGETDKSVLRDKPEIRDMGFKIGKSLKHIANCDCDIFQADGKLYLL
jgi:carbamoyl-phosphate synthase large subunit